MQLPHSYCFFLKPQFAYRPAPTESGQKQQFGRKTE